MNLSLVGKQAIIKHSGYVSDLDVIKDGCTALKIKGVEDITELEKPHIKKRLIRNGFVLKGDDVYLPVGKTIQILSPYDDDGCIISMGDVQIDVFYLTTDENDENYDEGNSVLVELITETLSDEELQKLEDAIMNFKHAYYALNEIVAEVDYDALENSVGFSDNYPFEKSFDELSIGHWTDEMARRIETILLRGK